MCVMWCNWNENYDIMWVLQIYCNNINTHPLNRICKQTWFCQHWMWLISTRSLHWNWNDGKSIKTKCKIQLFNLLHIRIALFENQSNIIGNLLRHYRVFANFDLIHNISFSEYLHTTHCIIDGKGSNILN